MKIKTLTLLLFVAYFSSFAQKTTPFSRGVNLSNWFIYVNSVEEVQFTKYSKQDFINIQSLGCDMIRLPVDLRAMTTGVPDYEFNPLFYSFLDSVVTWSEELELHLVIENHTFNPAIDIVQSDSVWLNSVWRQLATHYKESNPNFLYFEILEEPRGISTSDWGAMQQRVIETIREIDTTHTLVVTCSNFSDIRELDKLPFYSDTNLIYTFHFYDPFVFTHQGATFVSPSMLELSDIPFPYDAATMPSLPSSFSGTWVENAYNRYNREGNADFIYEELDIAINFRDTRNVPIWCSEWGVLQTNAPKLGREHWYRTVREYLEANEVAWTTWDYQGPFGLFNQGSDELFQHDLNVELLEALGLNVPPQSPYELRPDSTGLIIYDDNIGVNIKSASWISNGELSFYSTLEPNYGTRCIYWHDAVNFNKISFEFTPKKNFQTLVDGNYAVDLFIRTDKPDLTLQLRFVDTDEGTGDIPWRMAYNIAASANFTGDGTWQHLRIPMSSFFELGGFKDTWHFPEGKFDWTSVGSFEIDVETAPLDGHSVWFDNILISNQDTAQILNSSVITSTTSTPDYEHQSQVNIYPNPFDTFIYSKGLDKFEYMEVYDLQGRLWRSSLIHPHEQVINLHHIPKGMYLLRLEGKVNQEIIKIVKQ